MTQSLHLARGSRRETKPPCVFLWRRSPLHGPARQPVAYLDFARQGAAAKWLDACDSNTKLLRRSCAAALHVDAKPPRPINAVHPRENGVSALSPFGIPIQNTGSEYRFRIPVQNKVWLGRITRGDRASRKPRPRSPRRTSTLATAPAPTSCAVQIVLGARPEQRTRRGWGQWRPTPCD